MLDLPAAEGRDRHGAVPLQGSLVVPRTGMRHIS